MNVGENNRQPTRLRSVSATWFIKYCLPCRFFIFFIFYFLMFRSQNLLCESATTAAREWSLGLDTFFLNSYRPYSERPITNYPFRPWDDFHTSFDQRIEVGRNGPFMKIAFNMQILWGNLVKQCVDGLEESSVYIFFKMRNSLFSFRRDKPKPKQLRLPFSRKFLSNLIRHISHSTKKVLWEQVWT